MAFTNTPANVKGELIQAIALAAPGAAPFVGVEIGMKKKSKLSVTPNVTKMSSDNDWVDSLKLELPAEGLQNDFATLNAVNTFSQTYVQAYLNTAGGAFIGCVGVDSDDETLLGLEYEWKFKGNEDSILYKLNGEMAPDTYDAAHLETAGTATWTAGVDATKRLRPGVKSVTIGGAHLGALRSCEGFVKSRSVPMQLGRTLSTGCDVGVTVVLGQTDKDEISAAIAAAAGSDTVIVNFWDGRILKLTNLLGGKACTFELGDGDNVKINIGAYFPRGTERVKINTVVGTAEFIFLDNTAES